MAKKPRQFTTMTAEIKISTNPTTVRDFLISLSENCAENAQHECEGSPYQKDQLAMRLILHKAAMDIKKANKQHWGAQS